MPGTAQQPRTFQMPSSAWGMVKRIIRAYGAAQADESSTVETVANLAGIHRPVVSGNNNFLRSIGLLDLEKPKLTQLGVNLATGIGVENTAITIDALQESVRGTPILNQLLSTLRARGPMEVLAFRGQIILAVGLNEKSPTLPMVKTILDLMEESRLIEVREERVFLAGMPTPILQDNGSMHPGTSNPAKPPVQPSFEKPIDPPRVPAIDSLVVEQLLAKFPQFDPSWTDDVRLKWFDAFDRLMKGRGM